jgi:hypothetical protein
MRLPFWASTTVESSLKIARSALFPSWNALGSRLRNRAVADIARTILAYRPAIRGATPWTSRARLLLRNPLITHKPTRIKIR